MKIAEGLEVLDLNAELANGPGVIHPAVFHDAENVILVDTGLPGMLPQFQKAFEEAGIDFGRLNRIIITHSDMDHVGSLSQIVATSTHPIEVWAHVEEKPYIQADRPPIRMEQMKDQFEHLPEERRKQMMALYESLRDNYKRLKVTVTHEIQDREVLPCCGGIELIHTPGHTLGHVCLYHRGSKTLIAGDCLNAVNGKLVAAPDFTMIDKAQYKTTLKKLAHYDIQTVVCYHGGIAENTNGRIAEIAAAQQ